MPALYDWDQAWLMAMESPDAMLFFLTVYHPMIETFRMVRNNVDIVSRGDTYHKSWFQIDILNDNDQMPKAQIAIPNIDRTISIELQKLIDPAFMTLEVASSAYLDNPIARAALLELKLINIEPFVITGLLSRIDHSQEIIGTKYVVPSKFPGLFRRN